MNLFGFSRKQQSGSDDPYWEFNASAHFKPKISREEFNRQTGFDFGWLVLEPLSDMISKKRYEIERGRRLSYGQKSLYYWWYIDAEVTNGGFVQFYYNGYDEYVPTILRGLEYVNDGEMAALVQRADALYQKKKRIIDKARDEQSFGENLYAALEDFEVLDNEYYGLHHQTMQRFESYVRQHVDEFCILD